MREAFPLRSWSKPSTSQNFHTVLTEQLTQQCLHTPCQENAGTSHTNAKWQRTKASVRAQLSLAGVGLMQLLRHERRYPFFFPLILLVPRVKAPLSVLLRHKGPGKLAGPMAAIVKNSFPEEGWEFTDGMFRQSWPHFINVQWRWWRFQHCSKKAPEVFL